MTLSKGATAALLLVTLMLLMLFVGGEVVLGAGPVPVNLPNWPMSVVVLVCAVTVGITMCSPPARVPVGVTVLSISAVSAGLGPTDLLTFHDASAFAVGLGVACLAALWLVATGGAQRRRWWEAYLVRALVYVTFAAVLVPSVVAGAVWVGCARSPDDEMCGLGELLIGFPVAVLVWSATVVTGETIAWRRRHTARRLRLD